MNIMCVHINQAYSHSLLCFQYWERTSVTEFKYKISDICTMHNITRHKLITILSTCSITLSNVRCSQCQEPYLIYNRKDYKETHKNRKHNNQLICELCKSNNKLNYTKILDELYVTDLPQLDHFPYELAIQIYAGLQYLQNKNQDQAGKFRKNIYQLGNISNHLYIHNKILGTLFALKLIFPATVTDFELIKQNPKSLFKIIDRINWQIVPDKETLQSFMDTIQMKFIDNSRYNYKFIHETMCYEIAYYECFKYLHYRLNHHKYAFPYAEDTRLIIQKGLVFFSVAQMYYLIHQAIQRGSTLDTSKEQVGRLIRILEQLIEEYANNRHLITTYNRIHAVPQSHINNILFDKVYGILDCGFSNNLSILF